MLSNALAAVMPAVSTNPALPMLNVVRFLAFDPADGDTSKVEATNRYVAAQSEYPYPGPAYPAFSLAAADAKILQSALKKTPLQSITVDSDTGTVTFNNTLTFSLAQGDYPRTDQLWPSPDTEPVAMPAIAFRPEFLQWLTVSRLARNTFERKDGALVFTFYGQGKPAMVTFSHHFRALLMPARIPA